VQPERVRIKFCGLRSPADVAAAVRLGADYLGFVFVAASPRCVDVEAAVSWLADYVGVFSDRPARWVNDVARRLRLDLVQLHGHEVRDYPRALDVPAILVRRAVPAGAPPPVAVPPPPNVYALLIDAADAAGRSGGLGLRATAAAVRRQLDAVPPGVRVFLAGGLTPENVAAAVEAHRPYAVDVSSGIERAPGDKDPERMRAFAAALGRDV
jgi:phosphoribosylanthranilate isomerase